ncbi:hypothetical protein NBG4_80012 [Candidatus Sulfobium mesophilum]|uniref:Uncharacterized protein n=1 Tax=Candidatus Sulfobium mesophilum TaxID=2016548 RepID=A0A2U3QKK9_9BACT|nr:hypothetical protein NBG4_80012 [Candidatus Sulfobium mesophilum]
MRWDIGNPIRLIRGDNSIGIVKTRKILNVLYYFKKLKLALVTGRTSHFSSASLICG